MFNEGKLYSARDIEGEQNKKEIEIAREIESRFEGRKEFIGLIMRGSAFVGYSDDSSDIDFKLAIDSEKLDEDDSLEYKSKNYSKIEDEVNMMSETMEKKYGKKIHIELFFIPSIEYISKDLSDNGDFDHAIARETAARIFADMSKLSVGEGMSEYRKKIKAALFKMSPENQKKFLNLVSDRLADEYSNFAIPKMIDRGLLEEKDKEEKIEEISKLCGQRVEKIWKTQS